jgi:hypothetical protein
LAPALVDFGLLLVIAATLAFCGYLLIGLRQEKITESSVEDLLIEELVSDHPGFLLPLPSSSIILEHCLPAKPKDSAEGSSVSPT